MDFRAAPQFASPAFGQRKHLQIVTFITKGTTKATRQNSETQTRPQRENPFGASLCDMKRYSICTFRDVASAGPPKYQETSVQSIGFALRMQRMRSAKPMLYAVVFLVFGRAAEATWRKVQNDTLFCFKT